MSIQIQDRYERVLADINPYIEEKNLDIVTVSSLIKGCVQFSNLEEDPASVVVIDKENIKKSQSIKLSNIKVGLVYALDVIFSAKMIPASNDIWLILAVLKTILALLKGINVNVSEEDAVVLFATYRLTRATEKKITDYLKNNDLGIKGNDAKKIDVGQSLANLEELGCIRLVEGEYQLSEIVIIP